VLTSAHNLRGPSVTVGFSDGRTKTGQVKGLDVEGDLAVIAVDTGTAPFIPWPPVPAGRPQLGQAVLAVGPLPAGGCRVTPGHVSAVGAAFRGPRGRLITNGVEHTAPLGRGSSGGPVVDLGGDLLGLNTHRPGGGLYLAIPADEAMRQTVEALARGENPTRRRLGVALAPPHVSRRLRDAVGLDQRDGLLVREVEPDGPAGVAGLQRGDLIVAAGGRPVDSIDALLAAVDGAGPRLDLSVVRGVEEISFEVRFES
jgi:serine protease Do